MIQPKKAALALAPLGFPVLATVIIHHFFHETFGENNLTLGVYSRDIYIPLGLGAWVSFYHLQDNGVSISFRPKMFVSFLALLAAIILFLKNYLFLTSLFSHSCLVITLLMSCVFLLGTGFLCTLRVKELVTFVREKSTAALYALIAVAALLNYPHILKFFWREAAYGTARSVLELYRLFGMNLKFSVTPVSFNLTGEGFAIKIIMGCSGLEGIFFFIFAFSLIQCLHKRDWSWKVFGAYGLGTVFLFLLNTFRISLFYLMGIQFEKMAMGKAGKKVIEAAFHNHLGWILYLVGIIIFVRLYRKWEGPLTQTKGVL
ncbi:MAG: exosortase/archaeosortase family protein [Proteobacteria bacterium]|nr:exosortase/archaeosortase family protein [Pseudomonadota bacterium]